MTQLYCENCAPRFSGLGGALISGGHDCGRGCGLETYIGLKMCTPCAVEHNKCQNCEGELIPAVDASSRTLIVSARQMYHENVRAAEATYSLAVQDQAPDSERVRSATIARDIKLRRAARRFELLAERVAGHRAVDMNYARQLSTLTA